MSESTVIFRNGKAYLENEDRVPSIFVRDVVQHIPIHETKDYDKEELKQVLKILIEEKGSEPKGEMVPVGEKDADGADNGFIPVGWAELTGR